MNRARNLLVALSLILFLSGCNENTGQAVSVSPQSQKTILMDSLQKLDSLVLKYRVKNADESIKYAKQAGKIALAINTPAARTTAYNIFGNAYSAIRIDSGLFFYNKALSVIDSFNLTEQKGKVLYNLGMLNRSAGNYKNYIMLIDSALRFSISVNDVITMSNSLNALGSFYFNIGEKVNARKMFDSAFSCASKKMLNLQMGSALGNLARFETDEKKSIALSRQAISYLERGIGSEEPTALCLINIGYRVSDADSAIHYYSQAISTVSVEFAPEVIMGAYNNMAYCYLWKGDIKNAEKCMIEHALPVAVKTNNIDWQSTVYDTYADVLQRKGNTADAMIYRKKAIEAKKTYRALVGKNA
jgi:tetratricopeptide (TPR) repeat protein